MLTLYRYCETYRYCDYRWRYTCIVITVVSISDILVLSLPSWVFLTYWYCDYSRVISNGIPALWLLSCYLWRYIGIVITLVLSLTCWYCDTLVLSLTYWYCDYSRVIFDIILVLWLLSWVSLTYWYCDYSRAYLWHTGIVISIVLSLILYRYCDYSRDYLWYFTGIVIILVIISDILILWLLSWLSLTGIFVYWFIISAEILYDLFFPLHAILSNREPKQ
jgi:hypothetical protein